MQKSAIKLTNHQLRLANDTDYPLTKLQVIHSIQLMMDGIGKELSVMQFETGIHHLIQHKNYKVTRGENYKGLPYVVLDYPKIDGKGFPALTRTMFWWGKYFSFNLFIHGSLIDPGFFSVKIISHIQQGTFLLMSDKLWEQEILSSHYAPIHSADQNSVKDFIGQSGYLKLGFILPINNYESLNEYAAIYGDWIKLIRP